MKKILFTILLLFSLSKVYADIDITKETELKTKWYKEETEETYYKKGEELPGYLENPNIIIQTGSLEWSEDYCDETINRQERIVRKYNVLEGIHYLLIDNFVYQNNVTVLYKGIIYEYEIIDLEEEKIIIKFPELLEPHNIILFIDADRPYNVTLTTDHTQLLYKSNNRKKVLIPDNTWLLLNEVYQEVTRIDSEEKGAYVTLLSEKKECAKYEEQTYRYKVNKVYYDDNYHSYIDGYIRDYSDYKLIYKGDITKETIKYLKGEEIINYVEKECPPQEPIKEIEYKYIDNTKVIEKVPLSAKLIILGLILLIILMLYLFISKNVD